MEAGRSLLVGIDLCDDMAQISYYDKKIYEPVPVGIPVGDKYIYEIPSALLVNPNTNEWLWKTKENMQLGGYTLISNLLSKIKKSEKFQEGSYIFKTKDVVKKFMVKLLSLLNEHFPNETILKLVITIPERENVIVDLLKNILAELGIRNDRLVILGHKQSYMYYAVSQPKELWANSVGLFEFDEMGLRYTNLTVDKRTIPYIVGADVHDLSDIMPYSVLQEKGDVKYMFLNTANTMLHKKMVTTIYVTGKGFDQRWATDALKEHNAKMHDVVLAKAGTLWSDIDESIDIIPDNEDEIQITDKNVLTRETRAHILSLSGFAVRDNKTTRFTVRIRFADQYTCIVTLKDNGFGEFYPSTNRIWERYIKINGADSKN